MQKSSRENIPILEFWYRVFDKLLILSTFEAIAKWRRWDDDTRTRKLDYYVSANFVLSIGLWALCCLGEPLLTISPNQLSLQGELIWFCRAFSICWMGFRLFELLVYQIHTLLFYPYRLERQGKEDKMKNPRRLLTLLLMNFIEIIFWFALVYQNLPFFGNAGITTSTFLATITFSFTTMTTFGFTSMSPQNEIGLLLTFSQSAIGLFMILLTLARAVSILPLPVHSKTTRKR